MLDPQAKALIDLMVERKVPATHTLAPTEARRMYLERRGFSQPDPPAVGLVHDLSGPLPMRCYRPANVGDDTTLPVLVYLHGGGWTIGDLDTHDVVCRSLCAGAGCAVVSVDYRLGPEHRFPAAFDDTLASLRWVREQAAALALDPERIAVGGDSAGGNLAAAACLALRDAGDSLPVMQLLIYPATDMRAVAPSHTSNGQGYLLTADSINYFRGHYMGPDSDWADWRASPLLAASHAGLPPALVLTAGFDPLRDEGRLYADALSAAGTPAQLVCFERQIHGFITMGRIIDEANLALELCVAALRRAFLRR